LEVEYMERKQKAMAPAKETSLARAIESPLAWFDDVDRWFGSFRRSFEERFWGSPLARLRGSDPEVREPPVDLIDKGSEFVVRAEMPGVAKEDVDVTVTADGLEIRARADRSREEKEKGYFYQERAYRAFERTLAFPEAVKADLAAATLKDGVLEVRVPKVAPTPESKPVKVPVE
jgi:HSP20 family protein